MKLKIHRKTALNPKSINRFPRTNMSRLKVVQKIYIICNTRWFCCHLYTRLFQCRMKNVIIRQLYTVGMHHSGTKQLEVGPVYYCSKEPNNPKDQNAIAVYEDEPCRRRICYLRREDAVKLKDIITYAKGPIYLRAKFSAEKFSRFKGPMQNCSIGFKCSDEDSEQLQLMLKGVYVHKIY